MGVQITAPAQPMAVKTAISLLLIMHWRVKFGSSDMAAPTAPREVMGDATRSVRVLESEQELKQTGQATSKRLFEDVLK